jgi:heme exporter protein D
MNWPDLHTFLAMGGYGLYVWGAYSLTAALMLIEPVLAIARYRRALHAVPDLDAASSVDAATSSALPESA